MATRLPLSAPPASATPAYRTDAHRTPAPVRGPRGRRDRRITNNPHPPSVKLISVATTRARAHLPMSVHPILVSGPPGRAARAAHGERHEGGDHPDRTKPGNSQTSRYRRAPAACLVRLTVAW